MPDALRRRRAARLAAERQPVAESPSKATITAQAPPKGASARSGAPGARPPVLTPLPSLPRPAKSPEAEAISLLERRIMKLAGALESQEAQLTQLRQPGLQDPGVASTYREVQGLAEGDPAVKLKEELMERIFQANQELRERITSLRRLAE